MNRELHTGVGLVEFVQSKIGTVYAFGTKGEILTNHLLYELSVENPKIYTVKCIEKARKNIGKICVDASGLIGWYTGILRECDNYYDTAEKRISVSKLDETRKGWAVWKKGHIGVYVGDGQCVHAKGIHCGIILSDICEERWEYAIKLKDIFYD